MKNLSTIVSFSLLSLLFISCNGQSSSRINKEVKGGLYLVKDDGITMSFYNSEEEVKVDTTLYVPFSNFESIQETKGPFEGVFVLKIRLDEVGTQSLSVLTKNVERKRICFVIEEKVMAAPNLNEHIPNGRVSIMIPDEKAKDLIIDRLKK